MAAEEYSDCPPALLCSCNDWRARGRKYLIRPRQALDLIELIILAPPVQCFEYRIAPACRLQGAGLLASLLASSYHATTSLPSSSHSQAALQALFRNVYSY